MDTWDTHPEIGMQMFAKLSFPDTYQPGSSAYPLGEIQYYANCRKHSVLSPTGV